MDGINFSDGATYGRNGGVVQYSSQGQLVRFYQRPVLVPFKTAQEGREVFRTADYVKVSTPGEHDEIDREVTPGDKLNYAREYQDFLAGKQNIPTGTPLTVLFPNNLEIVEGMKAMKLHTVEQLAALTDHAVQNMPLGGLEWRAKAIQFLEVTRDAGRFGELEQKQKELQFQMEQQSAQIATLLARNAQLERDAAEVDEDDAAPRRGRPPRAARA